MRENHILIIDDDLMLLKTAEEILSDQYNVSVAKSGIQALNLLNKNIIPDLILLDIDMPQMDGYETLEEIKKISGCELIPIIFLTGFSEMDYEVRGLKAGAVDYIVKPFAKESYLPGLNGIWNDISRDSTKNPWNYQIMPSRSKAS